LKQLRARCVLAPFAVLNVCPFGMARHCSLLVELVLTVLFVSAQMGKPDHNGKTHGMTAETKIPIERFKGIPIFMKSVNRYPPGPETSVFV